MALCHSPEIIKEKLNKLLNGLEYVRAHIDNSSIISNSNFGDYLNKGEIVLKKLKAAVLKIITAKSIFRQR